MKDRLTPVLTLIALALLLFAYVGIYVALVEVGESSWKFGDPFPASITFAAEYRVGGRAAGIFYWPAHQIDRRVRSKLWQTDLEELLQ